MRHTFAIATSVAMLGVSAVLTAPSASAVGPTCTASLTTSFSPGLLLAPAPQTTTYYIGYSNCVTPGRPDVTSGSRGATTVLTRGCLSVLSTYNLTFDITWNTGETSTVFATVNPEYVAGQVVSTATGTVTSGAFLNSSVTEVLAQPNLNLLACAVPPGVQSTSGVGTLVVL